MNAFRKVALVTGITGQDGSYLAELLLAKGYVVHGLIRRASTFNTIRINHLYKDVHDPHAQLFLHYSDLTDGSRLTNLITEIEPDEIYNLAAQSHVRVSFDEPEYTGDTTGLGTVRILDAIRQSKKNIKFYQASSSEMYGATPPPQNEESPFYSRSPYGAAKVYSYWITKNYREAYGMFAVNGILFNHESPRRGETFVTRKITRAVANIKSGRQSELYLGNLDARRDWGYAPEYVIAMWKMLQLDEPSDFVVGTGTDYSVKEFVKVAFEHAGLNWENYVRFDEKYLRPTEVETLIGDASLAKAKLGWSAKIMPEELAKLMVDHDLKQLDGYVVANLSYLNGIEIKAESLNDIGILVPTLGTRIDYLVQCLNSIKLAGCSNVILVGPKKLLLESDALFGLFSKVIDDPGAGLPNAINLGIAEFPPSIKYVGWLGDDDLISKDSLENSSKIFEKNPDVVATYGACSYIENDGNRLFVNKSGRWASKFMSILPNLIPQPGSLFRRSAFESVGGVKPTFPLSFDFELFFNLRTVGKLSYIPEIQGSFRWHPNSLSVNQRKAAVLQTSKIRKLFLPKPLNLFAVIWEPAIIATTLLIGSILKVKMKRNR